jgi:hypothetical protein
MNSIADAPHQRPLERLVAALVDWGATASQIVSHMELWRNVHAKDSSRETVEVFRELLAGTLAPALAASAGELDRAAELVAQVDKTIRDEVLLVALPGGRRNRPPRRRRRG